MKPIIKGVLTAVAVLGLATACSEDSKTTTSGPIGRTLAPGETLPGGGTLPAGETLPSLPSDFTIPPGGSFPTDFSIPTAVIDQLITQFETAGMKVDRACLENLLKDPQVRELMTTQGTPSAELLQRFTACFKA